MRWGFGRSLRIQQAFFHNMPLAFATALTDPVDLYVPLNRELQSLLYWWTPDTKFTLDNPAQALGRGGGAGEFERPPFFGPGGGWGSPDRFLVAVRHRYVLCWKFPWLTLGLDFPQSI